MSQRFKEGEFFIPWFLLSDEQKNEIRSLSLLQRWKYHRENKKTMKKLKEYREKNPYKCVTVKLVKSEKP